MSDVKGPMKILLVEDDDDDYLLIQKAFQEADLCYALCRVRDGEKLMDYLLSRGDFYDESLYPRPILILLDLNMPRKDGREALKEIKSHPKLHKIPVIILTTSKNESDVVCCYELGANSFIRKPTDFHNLVGVVKIIKHYWLETVILPLIGN